jgi:DNA-binding beta-propeller fold protein YncE
MARVTELQRRTADGNQEPPKTGRPSRLLVTAVALLLGLGCEGDSVQRRGAPPDQRSRTKALPSPSPTETPRTPSGRSRSDRQLVWVAIEDVAEVAAVNIHNREVIRRHTVPSGPHNLSVAADGTVAVASPTEGKVSIIRRERVREIVLGGSPHDVKWAGNLLVVANEGAARLDLISRTGVKSAAIRLKADPHDVAISEDAVTAWVSLDGSAEIAMVNLERRTVRYVSTGKRPHDLLFDARGRVWVTDWVGVVHVFTSGAELVRTLELGTESHHLTFTPDGTEAWITDHGSHQIFVVGTKDLKVRDALPIAGAPHHVAITPDGRRAAVADHDNGALVIYGVATRREIAAIEVGPGPHGVWVVP